MNECRVCGHTGGNRVHTFRERYLGLGDTFDYVECAACGSLSIITVPDAMERYYPPDYYSYAPRPYNRLAGWLKGCRDRHYLGKCSLVGRLVSRFSAAPTYIEWLANLELAPGAGILDVGCGSGTLIANLKDAGFQATGIDPYIAGQIVHANGARVLKQSLAETTGSYDCLMLHHCLEHMDSPREAFKQIDRLLLPSGRLLIRIPVTGTYAWRTYGEHWFQLDAPRHAVLFTEAALCALAGKYGFQLRRIVYDSTASQFWGSEEYLQGIAHTSTASYGINPGGSIFTSGQVEEFAARAQELNHCKDGDQATFYFVRMNGQ